MEAKAVMGLTELYLDTHVLVWLYDSGIAALSNKAVERLESIQNKVISPMVVLEIGYLYEIEKITQPPAVIVHYLSERIGLSICAKPFHKVVSHALDLNWTRDPFDRLIAAQAGLDSSPLLTKDRFIHQHYAYAEW